MRRAVILLWISILLASFSIGVHADPAPPLVAGLSLNRTSVPELQADTFIIGLTLTNNGKETVHPYELGGALMVDGEAIDLANVLREPQGFSSPDISDAYRNVAPGKTWNSSYVLEGHCHQPGDYKLKWKGRGFESPEVILHVLRDIPKDDEPPLFPLVRALREKLPPGWEAIANSTDIEFYSYVKIRRIAPVLMASAVVINGNGKYPDYTGPFEIAICKQDPFVASEDYPRLAAENKETQAKMNTLARDMRHINHKFDSYSPKTPEEKLQVDQYEALKKTLHRLPQCYFGNISLQWGLYPWEVRRAVYRYASVRDKTIRAECREVTQRIIDTLKWYEPLKKLPEDDEDE